MRVNLISLVLIFLCQVCVAKGLEGKPAPSPTLLPLTDAQKKTLPGEFKKSLKMEERALDQEERVFFKELSSTQAMKLRNWREQEKKARRAFFDQNHGGPERRAYVQDFVKRKREFDQDQKDEWTAKKWQFKERRERLKEAHKARLKKFQEFYNQGVRDPSF